MRLAFVALVLLIGAGNLLHAQTNVRVLTYNIHRDIGASDSNISAQTALAKVVNFLKPDVWTINELGGNSVSFNMTNAHNFLVSFIQNRITIFGANPQENVNFFIYIGTINDGFITEAIVSRYSFASTTTYSDAGGGYGSLRGLVRASVNVPGAPQLDVFTAHLKANNTTSNAEQRQSEANTDRTNVANWIAAHPADGIAVTGDWNESEDPGERTNWSGHNIGDTLPNLNQPYQPITIMHSPGLIDPSPASIAGNHDTIDSTTPDARFDYTMWAKMYLLGGQVFDTKQYTAAQLAALNAANGTNFVRDDSAIASDHLPVLSIFQLGGTPLAPAIFDVSRASGTFSIAYQKIISSTYTYAVESSSDLVNWATTPSQNTILEQNGDIQTVRSTVATGVSTRFFLRVRLTISP